MKGLAPEVKVGLLTLAAGIALLYMSLKTAGVEWFGTGERMVFSMSFKSVAGLELRSKVKLSGVEIGYVDDIVLEDSRARLVIKLTREAPIRKNATGTILTSGLLGEKYIEIIQGTPEQPYLKDGETLLRTEEAADISQMLAKLGSALDDVKAVTNSLRNVFGTMEGEQSLKNILTNIDMASANMKLILEENRVALRDTLDNFSTISSSFAKNAPQMAENLERVAAGLREVIDQNKDNLAAGVANLKDMTGEFNQILKENRENLRVTLANVAEASGKVDEALQSIRNMSSSLEKVTGKIERGEGTIGKLVTDEQVYESLNKTLVGAGKFLDKAGDVRIAVGARGEYRPESKNSQGYFTLKIIPREDKYYMAEVTEDKRRVDLSTTRNTLNSLLYTILIAKRFSDVTVRGGVIESSAGVGADLNLFGDRFIASADLFNWDGYDKNAESAQLKAQLRWNLYRYLYVYVGGDELLNEYYRTFLLGGGILFDEDDLKLAIGLM